jgi:21S rRNA (GM2251-2'-O)-methyltransferase
MNFKENTPEHIKRIVEKAQSRGIKIKYLTREKLDKFTGGRPHNGLVLKSEPRDYVYIKGFETFANKFVNKAEGNLLVLLDQIVDPQNFGSIIRSAFFLGSDAILLNKKNKPPISSTVCKVSSGASECAELFAVKSVKKFLNGALSKGWTVVTTCIEKEHDVQLRLNSASNGAEEEEEMSKEDSEISGVKVEAKNLALTELNLPKTSNVILVLGSEANGISSDLSGAAQYNVYIPPLLNKELTGKHPYNIIDSLNVGVSAGIIINHLKSQLKRPSSLADNESENESIYNQSNKEPESFKNKML